MISPQTEVSISPTRTVSYRTPALTGVIVVEVQLGLRTPKINSWYEAHYDSMGFRKDPTAMFLDEILAYIEDAQKRVCVQFSGVSR